MNKPYKLKVRPIYAAKGANTPMYLLFSDFGSTSLFYAFNCVHFSYFPKFYMVVQSLSKFSFWTMNALWFFKFWYGLGAGIKKESFFKTLGAKNKI